MVVAEGALEDNGEPSGCQHWTLHPARGAQPGVTLAWGTPRPSLHPMHPGYLQGQLQAQVFRVVAEHSPGGAEEDVVHGAVLVLDVALWDRGSVRA